MVSTAEGELHDVFLRGDSVLAQRVLHQDKMCGIQSFDCDQDSDTIALINDYGSLSILPDTPLAT